MCVYMCCIICTVILTVFLLKNTVFWFWSQLFVAYMCPIRITESLVRHSPLCLAEADWSWGQSVGNCWAFSLKWWVTVMWQNPGAWAVLKTGIWNLMQMLHFSMYKAQCSILSVGNTGLHNEMKLCSPSYSTIQKSSMRKNKKIQ